VDTSRAHPVKVGSRYRRGSTAVGRGTRALAYCFFVSCQRDSTHIFKMSTTVSKESLFVGLGLHGFHYRDVKT
jgi:hypothetical protein